MPYECKEQLKVELFSQENSIRYLKEDFSSEVLEKTIKNICEGTEDCDISTLPISRIVDDLLDYIFLDISKNQALCNYITLINTKELIEKLDSIISIDVLQNTYPPRIYTEAVAATPKEFTGRDGSKNKILKLLETNLKLVLVNGIGGIGKSAICKELFHHFYKNTTRPIAWIEYDKKRFV